MRAGGMAALPVLGPLASLATAADGGPEQVVKLVAQRFHYTPSEVELVAGRPVVFEVRALDYAHGFNLPDLKQRMDLVPGVTVRLRVQFDQPGNYVFLCDNFCGDEHEDMYGRIVVKAAA
jgi:cytochrome c oxidase subunit 2